MNNRQENIWKKFFVLRLYYNIPMVNDSNAFLSRYDGIKLFFFAIILFRVRTIPFHHDYQLADYSLL